MTFKKMRDVTQRELFTTVYDGERFIVELEYHCNKDEYEAWMYREGYGVKEHIYGWPRVQQGMILTFDAFKKLVFDDLADGGYFDYYTEQYN